MLGRVLDMGGTGGILVASHLVGARDAADDRRARAPRARSRTSLLPLYEALAVAPAAVSTKAALRSLGLPAGTVRLPYVDLTEEQAAGLRAALAAHGLLEKVSP